MRPSSKVGGQRRQAKQRMSPGEDFVLLFTLAGKIRRIREIHPAALVHVVNVGAFVRGSE